ncbi:MAG TPA: hypothetical protein VKB86_11005 [Pyrinomonadaceae bacterium]|nr:hypothetical protein [Pyrinomonadaceae bacterium]
MPPNIIPAIAGAIVGALITMIGWFVTDYQRRKDARKNRLIDFTQRQIYELYAPLSTLAAKEQNYRRLRDDACSSVSEDRKSEVWRQCTDGYVIPAQKEIYNLLQNRWYLLVDREPPESFDLVLEHCSRALVLYDLDFGGIGHLGGIKSSPMPDEFRNDVERILKELRAKYNQLLNDKV